MPHRSLWMVFPSRVPVGYLGGNWGHLEASEDDLQMPPDACFHVTIGQCPKNYNYVLKVPRQVTTALPACKKKSVTILVPADALGVWQILALMLIG